MSKFENIKEKLEAYSREIYGDLHHVMSIDELIDSHRNIRSMQKQLIADMNNNWNSAREKGYAIGIKSAQSEIITVHDLSKMTLFEIAQFINEHKVLSND